MLPAPCSACNHLGRECTSDCVFAPHFPANQPEKFAFVYDHYNESLIEEQLKEVNNPSHRAFLVNSYVYGAIWRDLILNIFKQIEVSKQVNLVTLEMFNLRKQWVGKEQDPNFDIMMNLGKNLQHQINVLWLEILDLRKKAEEIRANRKFFAATTQQPV